MSKLSVNIKAAEIDGATAMFVPLDRVKATNPGGDRIDIAGQPVVIVDPKTWRPTHAIVPLDGFPVVPPETETPK